MFESNSLGTIKGGKFDIFISVISNKVKIGNFSKKPIKVFGISTFISISLDKKKISSFCP